MKGGRKFSRRLRIAVSRQPDSTDDVWKALADETRRRILEFLRDGPRTTGEIVEHIPRLSRFGVMKHLEVLRAVNLVLTRESGRNRVNALNVVPIRFVYEQLASGYADLWASTLTAVKKRVESAAEGE